MAISNPVSLITRADYKSRFLRTSSAVEDDWIDLWLLAISDVIEDVCRRKFREYEVEGISVYCSDSGEVSAATVTVTESKITLVSAGGANAGTVEFTFSDTSYDTLTELVAAITAEAAWTAALVHTDGTASSTNLTPAPAQSCSEAANAVTLGLRVDSTQYFSGHGQTALRPRRWPIQSVTSIKIDSDRDFDDPDDTLETTEYVIMGDDDEPESQYEIMLDGVALPAGIRNVQLVYWGGYAPGNMPNPVQLAAGKYFNYCKQRLGQEAMAAAAVGDGITAAFVPTMPHEITELLAPYRRYGF